jgi:hypothetical protein
MSTSDNTVSIADWTLEGKIAFIYHLWLNCDPERWISFNTEIARYQILSGHIDYIFGRRLAIYTDNNSTWDLTGYDRYAPPKAKTGKQVYFEYLVNI